MSTVALSGKLSKDGQLSEFKNKQGAVGYVYRNTLAVQTRQEITKTHRNTGEQVKDRLTTFMPIVVWGDRAQIFADTFKKGHTAHVTGEIMPREVQRADGIRYQSFELKVDGMLNENQARELQNLAFKMTHPNYVRQRAEEQAVPDEEENDFGEYDEEFGS